MKSVDTDRVAEAGYASWRSTATTKLLAWGFLRGAERHRWRLAASASTAREIRERCCIGLYIPEWENAGLDYQMRWNLVAAAMDQARRGIEREAA